MRKEYCLYLLLLPGKMTGNMGPNGRRGSKEKLGKMTLIRLWIYSASNKFCQRKPNSLTGESIISRGGNP